MAQFCGPPPPAHKSKYEPRLGLETPNEAMGLEYFGLKKLDWGLTNSGGVRRFPVQKSLKSISSQLFEFSENFRCIKSTNYTHLFKAKRILYYIFVNDT